MSLSVEKLFDQLSDAVDEIDWEDEVDCEVDVYCDDFCYNADDKEYEFTLVMSSDDGRDKQTLGLGNGEMTLGEVMTEVRHKVWSFATYY